MNRKDSFTVLVKPPRPLSKEEKDLTKISQAEMDLKGVDFSTAAAQLESFLLKNSKNLKHVRFAAWGTYFDIPILRKHYREHNIQFPVSGTALCVKTLALMWLAWSGKRTDKCSVESVAKMINCEPPFGNYHRALVDAEVTADILCRIYADFSTGAFINIDGKHTFINLTIGDNGDGN
jgi:inhibitor of KinA sporulation pathway (predicted exonuclease)